MAAGAPVLFTPRLVLRVPELRDFESYAAFTADPETMAHLGGAMVRAVAWRDFTLRVVEVIRTIALDNVRSVALARRLGVANLGAARLPAPLEHFAVGVWGQNAARWRASRTR